MNTTIPSIVLTLALSTGVTAARAQTVGPTLQEYLGERAADQAALILETLRKVEGDGGPGGLESIGEGRDAAYKRRLEAFIGDVFQFAEQIEKLVPLYEVPLSEPGARDQIEQLSGDLEGSIGRMRAFVNYGTDPPRIVVAPLPEETASVRVFRLVDLSRRLIPNIIMLAGSRTVELDLLNQVRDDLAVAEALSLALPRSAS